MVKRLGIETVDNYIEILPCVEADIAAVDDDVGNDEFTTYPVVTDYTKGNMTILDRDQLYDIIICTIHIVSCLFKADVLYYYFLL